MKLTKYEQETIINFNEEEKTASVFTHNLSLIRRLAEFAEKSSDCCLLRSGEGWAEYQIPKRWVRVNMPRQYSEEQKQQMAERARQNLLRGDNDER